MGWDKEFIIYYFNLYILIFLGQTNNINSNYFILSNINLQVINAPRGHTRVFIQRGRKGQSEHRILMFPDIGDRMGKSIWVIVSARVNSVFLAIPRHDLITPGIALLPNQDLIQLHEGLFSLPLVDEMEIEFYHNLNILLKRNH